MLEMILYLAGPPLVLGLGAYFISQNIDDARRRKTFLTRSYVAFALIFFAGVISIAFPEFVANVLDIRGFMRTLGVAIMGMWIAIIGAGSAVVTAIASAIGKATRVNED